MSNVKKKEKIVKQEYRDQVDPDLKSYADDPYFLKKAAEMKAFLIKNGVPPGAPPFEPFED